MQTANIIARLNRSRGLGGTDAMRIAKGDWRTLYNEKVGLADPVDLSDVFPVQLGIHTEPLHRRWFAKKTGFDVVDGEPFYTHAEHDFMFAHIDGWLPQQETFVEFKHSNARATLREKARYYMPQLQHYMAVLGTHRAYFSVIMGNAEPEWCLVDRNDSFIDELIQMEQSFWWHVTERVPPEIEPSGQATKLATIAADTLIDGLRTIDMTRHNEWASHVADWKATVEAAAQNETAAKAIKALVPEDAAECFGGGVVVRRDRRGRLSLRAQREAAND